MFQINSDSLIGKILQDGEVLFREGEPGRSMFIVLEGKLEVYKQDPHYGELHLETMAAGDVVGITSLFTKRPRSVSVRALGAARVLTIDKRGLLKRIQENPSVGLRLFEKLSTRILDLNEKTIS
ncbi:MAG: cyclic nucleotide-binding domain-containing protein, partial [Pseudomonadota bacterium]